MIVKVKKRNKDGLVRLETKGDIKEVLVNEDFKPSNESVSVCFKGTTSSGIVELSTNELEKLYKSVKDYLHLVKGAKKLKGDLL